MKGVIADAKSYESARRKKVRVRPESSYGGFVTHQQANPTTPLNRSRSEGESEEEEDFVRTWRKNRMQELRTGQATTRRQSPSKRKYGHVEAVDANGYLDAVEKVSSETVVVVTIFNEEVSTSS